MREGIEPPEDAPVTEPPSPRSDTGTPETAVLEPAAPLEPAGPRPTAPGSIARSAAVGVVAFVATIVLLAGFLSLVTRSPARTGAASANPSPTVAASTSASPTRSVPGGAIGSGSADAVLVGAGDIADCSLDKGAATATLVDGIAGTVFTAGDNAYPDGTSQQFSDCYEPTWGRFKARTRPAAGNHDWVTKDAKGYLRYFGAAAAPTGKTWYSYDLGAWHVIVLDSDCEQVGGCTASSPQGTWLASDLAA